MQLAHTRSMQKARSSPWLHPLMSTATASPCVDQEKQHHGTIILNVILDDMYIIQTPPNKLLPSHPSML